MEDLEVEKKNVELEQTIIGESTDKDFSEQVDIEKSVKIKKYFRFVKYLGFILLIMVLLSLFYLFIKISLRSNGQGKDKGEIVWWGIQHDLSVYKSLIDEYERSHPNIKIRYEKQSEKDYQVRLINSLASGKGPDIFEIHNTWPVVFRNELAVMPESIMSRAEYEKSFYPIIVSNLSLQKGIVGIPLEYDALALFINEDIFTSSLKSPPEFWDEVKPLAIELTQAKDRKIIMQSGVALGITDNIDHWPEIIGLMLLQNRVNPAKPEGYLAKSAITFYKDFSKANVWNNTLPKSTIAFARGELAMYFGPTRRAREIIEANRNLKFRTVKLPQIRKNNPNDPDYSYATYWVQGVSEKSNVKEDAWKFLKFLAEEKSLVEINDNIAKIETFRRIYPRPYMNESLIQDPILGSVINFAYDSGSFYLADNPTDGPNGINSLVNELYKKIVNSDVSEKTLRSRSQELRQILSKYGLKIN